MTACPASRRDFACRAVLSLCRELAHPSQWGLVPQHPAGCNGGPTEPQNLPSGRAPMRTSVIFRYTFAVVIFTFVLASPAGAYPRCGSNFGPILLTARSGEQIAIP